MDSHSPTEKTTIALFNYGGGMRGLIPAHFMTRLEEVTGLRMVDMVDIFTGPSTGAILNAAMVVPQADHPDRPKYKALHLVKFYEREGINIFPPDLFREFRGMVSNFNNRTLKLNQLKGLFRHGHYNPAYLNRALKALYGTTRLGGTLRSLVIPTYNIDRDVPATEIITNDRRTAAGNNRFVAEGGHAVWLKHIGTNYPLHEERQTPDVLLSDAVMASCAAPTYFPCHHFPVKYPGESQSRSLSGIDGVIFDNPCISYLGAIRRHVPPGHRPVMIVLGTGYTNKSIKKEDWNRYGALGVVDPVNDLPLINIFFNVSESALMESFEQEMGDNLYVFNKPMPDSDEPARPSTQIDDARPENLKALGTFFEEMLEDNKRPFEEICHLLVNNRDQRHEERRQTTLGQRLKHYVSLASSKSRHKD